MKKRIIFSMLIGFFLVILNSCVVNTNNNELTLKIAVSYPEASELHNLLRERHFFAFSDELSISKFKVIVYDSSNRIVYENFFFSSNIRCNFYSTPGIHTLLVQGFTNSPLYDSETKILESSNQVNLTANTINETSVNLNFVDGSAKITFSLSTEFNPTESILKSKLSYFLSSKNLRLENFKEVNAVNDTYQLSSLKAGVWDLTYEATIVDHQGVFKQKIIKELSTVVYPNRLSQVTDYLKVLTELPAPELTYPSSGATNIPKNVTLKWNANVSSGENVTYVVILDTTFPPRRTVGKTSSKEYTVSDLDTLKTYYWQVGILNSIGLVKFSPVASFTTENPNRAPLAPSNPNPANNAVNVSIRPTLNWSCSDPDNDPLTYDVYFGTSSNPPRVYSGLSSNSYSVGTLSYNTTYYWKIVAKDGKGGETVGPIWSFRTTLPPPQVYITAPSNNQRFTTNQITLQGYINNFSGSSATVYLNSIPRTIPVSNGNFSYNLILEPGQNTITVVASNEYGSGSATVIVYYDAPQDALWIELTWDKDLADIDLYIYEPDGNVVWYRNMVGRGELDRDDTDGYGPEHYTLKSSNAINGTYRVRVHYYSTNGQTQPVGCRVVVKKFGSIVINRTFTLSVANSGNSDPGGTGPDWFDVGTVNLP